MKTAVLVSATVAGWIAVPAGIVQLYVPRLLSVSRLLRRPMCCSITASAAVGVACGRPSVRERHPKRRHGSRSAASVVKRGRVDGAGCKRGRAAIPPTATLPPSGQVSGDVSGDPARSQRSLTVSAPSVVVLLELLQIVPVMVSGCR